MFSKHLFGIILTRCHCSTYKVLLQHLQGVIAAPTRCRCSTYKASLQHLQGVIAAPTRCHCSTYYVSHHLKWWDQVFPNDTPSPLEIPPTHNPPHTLHSYPTLSTQDQQGGVVCVLPRSPELHGPQGYLVLCSPLGDARQRLHPVEGGCPGRLPYLQVP